MRLKRHQKAPAGVSIDCQEYTKHFDGWILMGLRMYPQDLSNTCMCAAIDTIAAI